MSVADNCGKQQTHKVFLVYVRLLRGVCVQMYAVSFSIHLHHSGLRNEVLKANGVTSP